jgi:hypothetical protein
MPGVSGMSGASGGADTADHTAHGIAIDGSVRNETVETGAAAAAGVAPPGALPTDHIAPGALPPGVVAILRGVPEWMINAPGWMRRAAPSAGALALGVRVRVTVVEPACNKTSAEQDAAVLRRALSSGLLAESLANASLPNLYPVAEEGPLVESLLGSKQDEVKDLKSEVETMKRTLREEAALTDELLKAQRQAEGGGGGDGSDDKAPPASGGFNTTDLSPAALEKIHKLQLEAHREETTRNATLNETLTQLHADSYEQRRKVDLAEWRALKNLISERKRQMQEEKDRDDARKAAEAASEAEKKQEGVAAEALRAAGAEKEKEEAISDAQGKLDALRERVDEAGGSSSSFLRRRRRRR